MKYFAFTFLALFLVIATAQAQTEPGSENQDEAWSLRPHPIFHHPQLFPGIHPFPHEPHHPRSRFPNPNPNTYSEKIEVLDEQVKFPNHQRRRMASKDHECFMAVHNKKMGACLHYFRNYIMTYNIKLSAKCCTALQKFEDACQPLVKHPFLESIITHHCSAAAPSSSS